MPNKNLGPSVSGYDIPDGRSWETVAFKAGVPVLDRELVLAEDLDIGSGQAALKTALPSGWLSDDFLTTSDPTSAIFVPFDWGGPSRPNALFIPDGLKAHVNGWLLKIQHTNATTITGTNYLDLGTGPAGNGAQRTDLVFLEVWRRLISASPDTTGKSAAGRIWQEGNVATDPTQDLVLNYPDDILDTNVGSETTKRVQIQYRLRSIQDIDIFAFPYGMDDPTVLANSVPLDAIHPNGTPTAFTYANQSSNGDPGLWIAGDGNPSNALGTVDGYMYSIPLLAVFRRNTTAFDRRLNHNGGTDSSMASDRPDGLYNDIISALDLIDLRFGISATGWSLPELLEKNVNFVLDNSLRTEITDTSPYGGGYRGATVFMDNEIGISMANGGDGIVTGDTGSGPLIGQFDSICRRFSDRSIFETVTVVIPAPPGGWIGGLNTVTIEPTSLAVYPYSAFNWTAYAPAGVQFLDILQAQWIGSPPAGITFDALIFLVSALGLGSSPITSLTLNIAVYPIGITNEPLYVTLLVGYPRDCGLTRTPVLDYGSDCNFSLNTDPILAPDPLPATAPVSFSTFVEEEVDIPHREVHLQYCTVPITLTMMSPGGDTINLPERANFIFSVTINTVPFTGSISLDDTCRILTLGTSTVNTDVLAITYSAQRPLPQYNEQMTIYFRAAAPQMARETLLGMSLPVIPKAVSKSLYSLTTGTGSQDEGYPFPSACVQTGGIEPNGFSYSGESDLLGSAEISVSNFSADTGFLELSTYIPMVANPESLILVRNPGYVDVEGRSYFHIFSSDYIPNAYAQDLSDPNRHKNIFPILGELAEDSSLGYKGQLVLVLFLRYAYFDSTNGVFYGGVNDTGSASVFRIKGYLLNKRNV